MPFLLMEEIMANTVEYGLKFNADDLKKLEAMAKAIDNQNSEVIKKGKQDKLSILMML